MSSNNVRRGGIFDILVRYIIHFSSFEYLFANAIVCSRILDLG